MFGVKIISEYYLNSNFTCNKDYLLQLLYTSVQDKYRIMGTNEFFLGFYFMCMYVMLFIYITVPCACLVPKIRGECWIP